MSTNTPANREAPPVTTTKNNDDNNPTSIDRGGTGVGGITPPEWDLLLSAAQKNRHDGIRDMIEVGGVNPSHANAVGQSALHIASLWGHVQSVAALVELGAKVNAQNNLTGATPLHMVAQSQKGTPEQRLQVVDLLLQAGANPEQPDHYGSLPVHALQVDKATTTAAHDSGEELAGEELVQKFVQKLQPQAPPIHLAIDAKDMTELREILSSTTATTATENPSSSRSANILSQGRTPVMHVVDDIVTELEKAEQRSTEQIKHLSDMLTLLLDHGADANLPIAETTTAPNVSAADEVKESPLYKIVSALRHVYKDVDSVTSDFIIKFLEDAADQMVHLGGAKLTPETSQLLHQAARRNEQCLARFLLDRIKVDPNTKGRQGMTALQFAARSGQVEMLNLLLQQPGIDIHSKDDRGHTALDAARVNDKEDVVRVLEQHST